MFISWLPVSSVTAAGNMCVGEAEGCTATRQGRSEMVVQKSRGTAFSALRAVLMSSELCFVVFFLKKKCSTVCHHRVKVCTRSL